MQELAQQISLLFPEQIRLRLLVPSRSQVEILLLVRVTHRRAPVTRLILATHTLVELRVTLASTAGVSVAVVVVVVTPEQASRGVSADARERCVGMGHTLVTVGQFTVLVVRHLH